MDEARGDGQGATEKIPQQPMAGVVSGRKEYLLKYGNKPQVLADLPRCGAKARSTGEPCRRPGNKRNGRCHLHGGHSTGARTPEGKARIAAAQYKHGERSKAAVESLKAVKLECKRQVDEFEQAMWTLQRLTMLANADIEQMTFEDFQQYCEDEEAAYHSFMAEAKAARKQYTKGTRRR